MTTQPVLVVIGPSASGKSTVVRELARRGLLRVHPTYTTRRRRPDEHEGEVEHRFVTNDGFAWLDAHEFFLGTVALPGLAYRYGLPRLTLHDDGAIDTIMARAPFVSRVREHFPNALVYQIEDTPERARRRLLERNTPRFEVSARLDAYVEEARAGRAIAERTFLNVASMHDLVDAFTAALACDFAAENVPC
jgi:guanylate kinase